MILKHTENSALRLNSWLILHSSVHLFGYRRSHLSLLKPRGPRTALIHHAVSLLDKRQSRTSPWKVESTEYSLVLLPTCSWCQHKWYTSYHSDIRASTFSTVYDIVSSPESRTSPSWFVTFAGLRMFRSPRAWHRLHVLSHSVVQKATKAGRTVGERHCKVANVHVYD